MLLSSRRPLTVAAVLLGLGLSVQAQAGVNNIVMTTASPNPANAGQLVTLTTTVTGTGGACTEPTGTVTFLNQGGVIPVPGNPVTLTPGTPSTAILQTTLPVGANNLISANYSGDVMCGTNSGGAVTEDITNLVTVPTLAEWGKIGFAGLLLLGGLGFLARRARNNGAR
jgi:hypothetical protein